MSRADNGSGLCRRLVLLEEQLKLAAQRRPIVDEARRLARERRRTKLRGIGVEVAVALGRGRDGEVGTDTYPAGK
jgi:hypothetical protein